MLCSCNILSIVNASVVSIYKIECGFNTFVIIGHRRLHRYKIRDIYLINIHILLIEHQSQ